MIVGERLKDALPKKNSFRHEALFYKGDSDFIDQTTHFIREGLEASEPVLVAVIPRKIGMIRDVLGTDAQSVHFVDMARVGKNPARIIPVWQEFVSWGAERAGAVRGIGEPIWAGRSADEVTESQLHESLINVAFTDVRAWILCPYDMESLGPEVIEEAFRSHPTYSIAGQSETSATYRGSSEAAKPFGRQLPAAPSTSDEIRIVPGRLSEVRSFVSERAAVFGLSENRVDDLVVAVTKLATNTLRHGGGQGTLRVWHEGQALVCEVEDSGQLQDPLLGGSARPSIRTMGGVSG
ncbi:MAG: sensor histidine kinase [Actinomycetota bacterium]|nr:sensor histidine kinase [Actinomycetota bacterium]